MQYLKCSTTTKPVCIWLNRIARVIEMQVSVAQTLSKFTLEPVSFIALVYLGILFTLSSALYKICSVSIVLFCFSRCLTSGH